MSEIEKNAVAFAKLHPDAILPSKRPEDAGYDVYALDRETDVIIQPTRPSSSARASRPCSTPARPAT